MATTYKLNAPQFVQGQGVVLSWTWPIIPTHEPEYYIYLQKSTTKSNWPLQPYFQRITGSTHVPTADPAWQDVKQWHVTSGTKPTKFTDPVGAPTTTTYYRLIAYVSPIDGDHYTEYDWQPASIGAASVAPGETVWGKALVSNANGKNVRVLATAVDVSGNVAITGTYMNTVDFGGQTLVNASSLIGYFVAKYTPTGSLIWVRGVTAATGISVPFAIAMDVSGNVFTTGYFAVSVTIDGNVLTTTGFEDIFVFKHAQASGALSWHKEFGGTRSDYGKAIVIDSAQNPVIIGNFSDSITFGATTLTSGGGQDLFLTKLSTTDGSVTFAKGYGYTGDESVYGAASDKNGNIYVIGQMVGQCRFATGGTIYTAATAGDIFIVRYNSSGDYDGSSWVKQYGSVGFNYGFAIAVDNSPATPQIIAVGSFQGAINFGGPNRNAPGGSAAFVIKLGADASYVWDATYGGSSGGSDSFKGVAVDANRNIVITSQFISSYGFGPDIFGNSIFIIGTTPDILVLKLDRNAVVLWVKRYIEPDYSDEGSCCAVAANGNIIIGGYFIGAVNLGNAGTVSSPLFNTQAGIFFKYES